MTCGCGERGNLGNGGSSEYQPFFETIESILDHDIVDVAAGADFTLALTSEGEVLGWGNNSGGQLGGGALYLEDPLFVQDLPPIRAIAAGESHAAAIDEDGNLYMVPSCPPCACFCGSITANGAFFQWGMQNTDIEGGWKFGINVAIDRAAVLSPQSFDLEMGNFKYHIDASLIDPEVISPFVH